MLHQLEESAISLFNIAQPVRVEVNGDQDSFHHRILVLQGRTSFVQVVADLGRDLPDALPAGTLRHEELMLIRVVPGQLFFAGLLLDLPGLFFEYVREALEEHQT